MAYRGEDMAPLLPSLLKDRLNGWVCKVSGLAVLVACVAAGISLLTWSAADPSLTHATSGATRNVLGPVGAILSDLLMQMLGLAGVLFLLPPLFWALQLLTMGRLDRARVKLALTPLAVISLAAALSALPAANDWPLSHGFGGFLGDRGLSLFAGLLSVVNPERASIAAGLFYFALGLMVLVSSLGLTQQDLRTIFDFDPRQGLKGLAAWWHRMGDLAYARGEPLLARAPSFDAAPAPQTSQRAAVLPAADRRPAPMLEPEPPIRAEPRFSDLRVDEPAPSESHIGFGRDASFDHSTERESRDIARRFAPGRSATAARDEELVLPLPERREPPAAPAQPRAEGEPHRRPPLSLLRRAPAQKPGADLNPAALQARARLLEQTCADFGVKGEVKAVHPGPVVTLFEFEPARGVKSARVINLADDIARAMSAQSVRVAVVPGRNAIGIELPNARRDKVHLRDLLESEAFRTSDTSLPLVLGKTISGTPVFADLARMPHLLVAGTTGSGKSVGVNAMILSLLYRLSPDQCRFLMIDPKMLELSVYNGIPHLLCPVVTDPQQAVAALNWVVAEMEQRYRRMSKLAVRNIDAFNGRLRHAQKQDPHDADLAPMPYIVVVVDEFADLMLVAGKEIESAVQRLAQMARAAGIHLIMATQRPSVDVITGTIKANFPTRISFKVASKFDSRTILNEQGAEQLLGQGDMLFWGGSGSILRVHGPFVSDEEVEGVARYLSEQGSPRYVPGITDTPDADEAELEPADARDGGADLYARAIAIVRDERKASTSYLQRRLGIGYNRAADLIERMEREAVISAPGYQGRRQILLDKAEGPDDRW